MRRLIPFRSRPPEARRQPPRSRRTSNAIQAASVVAITAAAIFGPVWLWRSGLVADAADGLKSAAVAQSVDLGLRVENVFVTGRVETTVAEILGALEVERDGPILDFDPQAARRRVEALPWVARAAIKSISDTHVGDTVLDADRRAVELLPGYREVKPMVFAGLYPGDAERHERLREALEKLKLNDAAINYEPESSEALGFGFRCGFLGLLHMEIVRERLEREYDLDLVSTVPNVEYLVHLNDGSTVAVENPARMPPAGDIDRVEEPYVRIRVLCPDRQRGNRQQQRDQ